VKFERFLGEMVPSGVAGPSLQTLLDSYAEFVKDGLRSCDVAIGLRCLREFASSQQWFVASGGDQNELREVFADRGLADLFDGGIFGSPDIKDEILRREQSSGHLSTPALFLGDSRYDHQAAASAGLNFIFVSEWSEFAQWPEYCEKHSIPVISTLSDLLPPEKGIS
jgi:phosphoglycolate phosphatase-like HAD superfamily hydrolase